MDYAAARNPVVAGHGDIRWIVRLKGSHS